jgi:hypothetical protein
MHNEDEFEAARKQEEEDLLLLKAQMQEEEEEMATPIRTQNEKMTKVKEDINYDLCHAKKSRDANLQILEKTHADKKEAKMSSILELQESGKGDTRQLQCDIDFLREKHTKRLKDLSDDYNILITKEQVKDVKLRGEMQDLGVKHLDIVNEIEDQAESELLVEQQTYESATHQEVSASRRLTEEIDITWKKHTTLVKDSEEHRESILSLQETHQELNEDIKNLTQQQRSMEEDGQNQHISIIQIEREIQISSEENDTIERFVMFRKL